MHVDGDAWLPMRALAWALMNRAAAMFGGLQQRCTQRKTQRCSCRGLLMKRWQAGRALWQELGHRA